MKRTLIFLFLGVAALLWGETVINGSRSILGTWNAGGAVATIPAKVGTTAPATCTVGEQFFDSDAAAGSNLLLCTSVNVWTAVTSAGGGGSAACTPGDLRWTCSSDEFVSGNTTSGGIGALGWSSTGTIAYQTDPDRIGVVNLTTGSASGNTAHLMTTASGGLGDLEATTGSQVQDFKWVFKVSSTTDITLKIGLGALFGTATFDRGFGLGISSGNWAVCYNSAYQADTCTSIGVAADTNWHTLRIYSDGTTARKYYLSLDGSEPVTFCESGCSVNSAYSATWQPYRIMALVQTNTSATRTLSLDYFSMRISNAGTSEHVR